MNKISLLFVIIALSVGCSDSFPSSPIMPSSGSSDNSNESNNEFSKLKSAISDLRVDQIPDRINGVELTTIRGWLASTYSSWNYIPEQSTVHPVPSLWTPNQPQSFSQIAYQSQQLKTYGSGADIIQFNPHLDYNYWAGNGFDTGGRPFFVAYEHINGTKYSCPTDCSKDMNLEYNRQVFREDIDFIFRRVILRNWSRYVTVNDKAVIYMWSSAGMKGDFGSLLEEVKAKYPVFFIGSNEIWGKPKTQDDYNRVETLDGFMEYTLGGHNDYRVMTQIYNNSSVRWSQFLRQLSAKTGKKYLFIPTFQVAYDDHLATGRNTPQLYPRNRNELVAHADGIRSNMGGIYDLVGPFVVQGELFEGGAVLESQCRPDTQDRPSRYVGCGTKRLEILKEKFGY